MAQHPTGGTDGPYAAPLRLPGGTVRPEWIDYNGHMNTAYYVMAFDLALDHLLDVYLGIGEAHVAAARQGPYALQSSVHYLGEMLEGEAFDFSVLLVDCDAKRMHVLLEMFKQPAGTPTATLEQIIMNVDLITRRSAPYSAPVQARLVQMRSDHSAAPRAVQFGKPLGLRRPT